MTVLKQRDTYMIPAAPEAAPVVTPQSNEIFESSPEQQALMDAQRYAETAHMIDPTDVVRHRIESMMPGEAVVKAAIREEGFRREQAYDINIVQFSKKVLEVRRYAMKNGIDSGDAIPTASKKFKRSKWGW